MKSKQKNKKIKPRKEQKEEKTEKEFKKKIEKKENDISVHQTKIRIIGIGGGGGSIVSEISSDIKKVDFVAANTDYKSLKESADKVKKFQFGFNLTKGLGTGMNDELGENAAISDKERIKELLKDQDLVILVSCLGGGTGSGATNVFAKTANNLGVLTYGIFTLPFDFEGEKKMEIAQRALEKIKNNLNAYSIIPNERIFNIIDKDTPLKNALSSINRKLAENLEGLIEMIYSYGLINIDFADLKTIFSGKGKLTYLNSVEINEGGNREEEIKKLISSPLYPYSLNGAKGILYNIESGKNLKLSEVSYISKIISEFLSKQTKVIFGIDQSQKDEKKIKITLLATGCNSNFLENLIPKKEEIKKPKKIINKNNNFKKNNLKLEKSTEKTEKREIKEEKNNNLELNSKEEKNKENNRDKNLEKVEIKLRKNGIDVKKEIEKKEEDLLAEEKLLETPAIFRKNNNKNNN
ncbi:MAG TPA: cell division protein FtsZ [Candidatus Pacearchaeota archaeon]|mgnify:CR=1 FL=1|nr:cell division protein FtsZ [Candidatus Pacearchaeota archaeon]